MFLKWFKDFFRTKYNKRVGDGDSPKLPPVFTDDVYVQTSTFERQDVNIPPPYAPAGTIARKLMEDSKVRRVTLVEDTLWRACKFTVEGGDKQYIAQTLWETKPFTLEYYGDTVINITCEHSGIKYSIAFNYIH